MTDKVNKISIIFILIFMLAPIMHIAGQSSDGRPVLRTVVIDPGHGGKDPGAPGPGSSNSEKHIVLKISKLFGEKIKKEYPSVKVVYTRSGDSYPTRPERVRIAHDNNADLFISIHCNSNNNKSASGTSAHILARKDSRNPNRNLFDESVELTKLENSVFEIEEKESGGTVDSAEDQILTELLFHANFDHSVLLAQLVVENLARKPFHKWGRGIHQNDFLLLKKLTCPAILVETAFLSNPDERQLLISEKWQKEIADRLFEAFRQYKEAYDGSMTSEEPENKTVTDESAASPSYYSVQIMGLGRLLKDGDPALKGLKAQAIKGGDSNIYKYVCGRHASQSEAAAHLPAIRRKFPEAFLVRVDGDKITIVR